MLSPLLFAVAVDVILENAREYFMNEILYTDDLVLMSESMENLKERFLKWEEAFDSKGLNEPQENQSNDERFERWGTQE